jgi:hypothetical protein
MVDHKNKWENARLMDGYCIIGMMPIPYPCLGVIINIVSKEDNTYHATISDILKAHVRTSPKCWLKLWKKIMGVSQAPTLCVHFLCKVEFKSDKFIHAPTYIYNKVMCLHELANVVAYE